MIRIGEKTISNKVTRVLEAPFSFLGNMIPIDVLQTAKRR
jgi:hypothetical protein